MAVRTSGGGRQGGPGHGRAHPRPRFSWPAAAAFLLASFAASPVTIFGPPRASRLWAAETSQQVRDWFAELAHPDAEVRERACVSLMGLGRPDLNALRALVEESRPLLPSQAAVLRRIVTQVFLASEPYDGNDDTGFLGVRMEEATISAGVAGARMAYGVVIVERMPGFVGARMLQDGDVILGIVEQPDAKIIGTIEFGLAVRRVPPGETIHFEVLRQGRVVQVPIRPDPRPDVADHPGMMEDLLHDRKLKVKEYWERAFAPLLKEVIG